MFSRHCLSSLKRFAEFSHPLHSIPKRCSWKTSTFKLHRSAATSVSKIIAADRWPDDPDEAASNSQLGVLKNIAKVLGITLLIEVSLGDQGAQHES
jgi:hypothetical protein